MKKGTFTSICKLIFLILSLALFNSGVQAQTPSSNIGGPLKAYVSGADVSLTSEIASPISNPTITYSFDHNSSGATIVSQGAFVYDRNTGTGKQTVVVRPGNTKGSFTVKLLVTTPQGTSESSKSVTVTTALVGTGRN